jgi:transposase
MRPTDLPPWEAVYQQTQRGLQASVFDAIVHELRMRLRLAAGREEPPSATILESRTRPSSPERGHRAGDDGATRQRGRTVPRAVETLGHWLAWHVTPAAAQDRAQVAPLTAQVQDVTGDTSEVACVDPGDTGDHPAQDAAGHGLHLDVGKRPAAKNGFVRLPRRWVVERSFAWAARFRRLSRDDERRPATLAGFHVLACVMLMRKRFGALMVQSA